ncbi:MAG: 2,3-bisphosphoglycerate-independent phosphoglycerate mutase [Nitrospirae bacterium]|nr:2,3-bisphosphoglycerate-independent phosphoglycerate mutase [Nitrospirota bacterium]
MEPVMLIVLDGWGLGNNPEFDATEKSNIPFYKSIIKEYPHTALECSGEAVGLPEGQMGNSEVGHLNLGAGRIVYQDYAKINKAIRDGDFQKNPALIDAMNAAVTNNSAVHLPGLLSDGGVHSHIRHLYALIDMALLQGVKKVFIHAFMDGRDTPPASGINYIRELEAYIKDKPSVKIATVTGRYWAMDRDKRWDRVEQAYNALVLGKGKKVRSAEEAVEQSYKLHENDEFIKPSLMCNGSEPVGKIHDGDSVIFFNFRADRARELTRALTDKEFPFFERGNPPALSSYMTMTLYDETFSFPVAFPPTQLNNILAEVLSGHNLKQLRIAETEKYAHVTYFFNGGEEKSFDGEDRSLVPSPRDVATYDLKPEMSAYLVTDEVVKKIQQQRYDFILLNFANPDMVGHTGIMEAAVKACEAIDKCLKRISEEIDKAGGLLLITADHGNCELMFEDNSPFTAHTTNLVPFILLKKGVKLRDRGILADVAPTLLELMGIKQPEEMTGKSLIEN